MGKVRTERERLHARFNNGGGVFHVVRNLNIYTAVIISDSSNFFSSCSKTEPKIWIDIKKEST